MVEKNIGKISRENLYISAISVGEIIYGIEKLAEGKKKNILHTWIENELLQWFEGNILILDTDTVIEWGRLRARHTRTLTVTDSLIAASAITHHMTLLTRNAKDFAGILQLSVINPWE
jgi:predicted nucleic acid-binding protein